MRMVEFEDIRTSALGFGCASVMGRVGKRDSLRAMETAWEAGVRLFDVARSYGYGEAEGLLGEFLQGKREQATVVTKFGILPSSTGPWKRRLKPMVRAGLGLLPSARGLVRRRIANQMSPGHFDVSTLRTSLETSLRELKTDHVDMLLAHEATVSDMGREDLLAELEEVVREGKARRVGVACTAKEAALVAMRQIPLVSVLQFPAQGVSDWPKEIAPHMMRIGNHPFFGGVAVKRVAKSLMKLSRDARVDAALRDKLTGNSMERVAEFWFTRARLKARPHAIVASMLHLDHLRADLAAIESERFSADDVKNIEQWISSQRLLD